jgi:glycosyltransferase involved in cell wall biosynthesis
LVLTAWGTDIYSKLKESRKNRIFTKYALRRADLVTGDSKNIMDECITLGASPTICHVIINGVDSAVFYPREDCEDLIEKLKLKDRRIIISNRHFSPPYNIDIIIRAIPLVLERYADAVFILKNAYGYQEPELRKLAEELGVSSAVRFVGAVDYPDMAKYLSISELFLSVPSWDSSSVSMLEAMACGAVPIVSDLPAAREWIREGYNGYLVPTKDHVALAEKITGLLHDRKRRENFRQRNFELVTKADQNANMEKMEKLYLRLLVEKGQ